MKYQVHVAERKYNFLYVIYIHLCSGLIEFKVFNYYFVIVELSLLNAVVIVYIELNVPFKILSYFFKFVYMNICIFLFS